MYLRIVLCFFLDEQIEIFQTIIISTYFIISKPMYLVFTSSVVFDVQALLSSVIWNVDSKDKGI